MVRAGAQKRVPFIKTFSSHGGPRARIYPRWTSVVRVVERWGPSLGLNRALDHIRERALNIIHVNRGKKGRGIEENTEGRESEREGGREIHVHYSLSTPPDWNCFARPVCVSAARHNNIIYKCVRVYIYNMCALLYVYGAWRMKKKMNRVKKENMYTRKSRCIHMWPIKQSCFWLALETEKRVYREISIVEYSYNTETHLSYLLLLFLLIILIIEHIPVASSIPRLSWNDNNIFIGI